MHMDTNSLIICPKKISILRNVNQKMNSTVVKSLASERLASLSFASAAVV
jgi:hypothetical protein